MVSGDIDLSTALWKMFEWCQQNLPEGERHEVARATECDEALLEMGALREKVADDEAELGVGRQESAIAKGGVIEAEKRRAEAQELADHRGMRLMRF